MNAIAENRLGDQRIWGPGERLLVRWPHLETILGICLFEVAFYFAYCYGMSFSQVCASPFWFPDSVLLCALLLSRPGKWWFFVAATLPIRLLVAVPPVPFWFLLATFAIDSAKGLITTTVLHYFRRNPFRLETIEEFVPFFLFAVVLVPVAAAFCGAAALRHALGNDYWLAWQQWFMGNALTHLVVTPALLYWVLRGPWKMRLPGAICNHAVLYLDVGPWQHHLCEMTAVLL